MSSKFARWITTTSSAVVTGRRRRISSHVIIAAAAGGGGGHRPLDDSVVVLPSSPGSSWSSSSSSRRHDDHQASPDLGIASYRRASSSSSSSSSRTHVAVARGGSGRFSSPSLIRLDDDATDLVDVLLRRTYDEMDHNVANVVAFSGGVDSSLVAALVVRAFSDRPSSSSDDDDDDDVDGDGGRGRGGGSIRAVLGVSDAVPQSQVISARQVAEFVGIPLTEVTTTEGDDVDYVRNDGRACYVCKTHLYSALEAVAMEAAITTTTTIGGEERRRRQQRRSTRNDDAEDDIISAHPSTTTTTTTKKTSVLLYNGTNADDVRDPTRLGLLAASDFHVRSPLDRITKGDVRRAARHLGLPNWDAAASPCLRSRLAFGVEATRGHLRAVEMAEAFVRDVLELDVTSNARVRMLSGGRAMVELDDSFFVGGGRDDDDENEDEGRVVRALLIERGFEERCVGEWGFRGGLGGVRPFRTGSVAVLPPDDVGGVARPRPPLVSAML